MTKLKLLDFSIIFGFGAVSYGLLEVVARGYTHPSMLLAGGICFLGMWGLQRLKMNFIIKCLLSAGIITAVEFVFGYIFNIILKMAVWDYSDQPFNILGQVCLKFFIIWCFVSAGGLLLAKFMRLSLSKSAFSKRKKAISQTA